MVKYFHHRQQLNRINELKKSAASIDDRLLYDSIITSILDSKSHRTISNNMVTVQMNHSRYLKYMERVVKEEQQ